jgi:hypothetical protein
MKYTYLFANGEINEIEVTDEYAFSLFELDRLEYARLPPCDPAKRTVFGCGP